MDTYSVSKVNRLFWLGRYSERVLTMTQIMMKNYDTMIDGGGIGYQKICVAMGIPDHYGSERSFVSSFLFDPADGSGVAASVQHMLDNAMLLRENHLLAHARLCANGADSHGNGIRVVRALCQPAMDY